MTSRSKPGTTWPRRSGRRWPRRNRRLHANPTVARGAGGTARPKGRGTFWTSCSPRISLRPAKPVAEPIGFAHNGFHVDDEQRFQPVDRRRSIAEPGSPVADAYSADLPGGDHAASGEARHRVGGHRERPSRHRLREEESEASAVLVRVQRQAFARRSRRRLAPRSPFVAVARLSPPAPSTASRRKNAQSVGVSGFFASAGAWVRLVQSVASRRAPRDSDSPWDRMRPSPRAWPRYRLPCATSRRSPACGCRRRVRS